VLVVLGLVWRGKERSLRSILWIAGILLVLGILGTFPTFFEAFASD
jgi:hypothetical protein